MPIRDIMPWRRRERSEVLASRDAFEDTFMGLQKEMNRLFDNFFSDFGMGLARPELSAFTPRVDVKETADAIKVEAELPGLSEDDLEITLDDRSLIIKGEKKAEKEEKDKGYHLVERSYGAFYRRLPLPAAVEDDKVEAAFDKGVLHVTLKKSKQSREKTVQVKTK